MGYRVPPQLRWTVRDRSRPVRTVLSVKGLIDTLVENSLYGIGITGVTSALGFVFWVVAARSYSAHAVGLATALISAMTLVAMLSNLGGGAGLIQRIPQRRSSHDWSLTINTSLLLCGALALVASALTILVLPLISTELSVVRESWAYGLTLTCGIVLWTLSINVDFLFVAERKVKYGFVRNTAFSVLKLSLVLLPVLLWGASPLALFGTWVVSSGVALVISLQLVRRKLAYRWTAVMAGMWGEVREMISSLVGHHVINLGGSLPMYLLPLIVTARLGVVENAWAYVGWMVGGFALVVSPTVSASLFAEGSHDPTSFRPKAVRSFKLITALFVPVTAVVVVLGRPILGVFGAEYAAHSYGLVVLLAVSAIPDAVTNVYVAAMRVYGRLREAAVLNMSMASAALALAWWLVLPLGVAGIACAWLIAQTAGALYASVRLWGARTAPTADAG
jgi:O-antigen/teichoic acid export membrane protein